MPERPAKNGGFLSLSKFSATNDILWFDLTNANDPVKHRGAPYNVLHNDIHDHVDLTLEP